ncbi:MAG: hypothetical protein FD161_2394 [Limisphaerales bacterium]|nr:MAG: hypothetical protein FD161_2394 [Limisphaerales bacterium]KAG0508727.1 MAG: hypothetical protein E1N63_2145 [Limisphaerales bacterium]TXT50377.1 MAG: hypothetical protein FD140_2448 [Limisphaerales bacterium]
MNFTIYARPVDSYRARVKPVLLPALLLCLAATISQAADRLAIPDSFECPRATGPVKIDGMADEPAWAKAVVIESFVAYWAGKAGRTKTKARLMWDDEHLYFHAEMEDADLYSDVRETNGYIWENDVFELFFRPSEGALAYYEFQVNPLNAQFHAFFPSRGAGSLRRARSSGDDRAFQMKTAVMLRGTLNNWRDNDTGWSVEGRIPWKDFNRTGGAPKPGDTWRFALCRYDYSKHFESPDLTSCAPLTAVNYHRYEDYARLKFVAASR